MADFEDYESDEPDDGCSTCGDPLCPGCDPSPQSHLIKLALALVFLVFVALYLQNTIFGEDESNGSHSSQGSEASNSLDVSSSATQSTQTTTQTEVLQESSDGPLTEQNIRSVVQVVLSDARGLCRSGSGTVIGNGQLVLTNFHVVQPDLDCPSPRLEIWTVDSLDSSPQSTFIATVVLANEIADLAVLRLIPHNSSTPSLQAIPLMTTTSVGEEIFVVGFPGIGGSSITVSKGVVSGYTKEGGVSWIKTDASISGGSSGGAAFNSRGELIGVPTRASVGIDGRVVDCRPTLDTNGDGQIDTYDACQPIGGFLNLLSPASQAESLVRDAERQIKNQGQSSTSVPTQNSIFGTPENNGDSYTSDPRFSTCREAIKNGYGPYIQDIHVEYDWYIDADSDGVVCER